MRRTLIRQIETQHADSPSPEEHSTSQAPDERNPPDSTRVNPPRPEVPNEAIPSTKQAVEPADQEAEDTQQRSRRDPRDRGGHPRGSDHSEVTGNPPHAPQPATPRPRAHLCVWMEGMEWQLGVEVGLATERALTVQQGDQELEQDEFDSERWLLTGNPGAIQVLDGEESVRHISDLEHELVPLVFRLSGDLERGVQVRRPTAGAFLLLVPSAYGEPVFTPPDKAVDAEPVSPSDFQAYFIDAEPGLALTVRIDAEHEINFRTTRRMFHLKGTLIEDAAPKSDKRSSRQGPLYGRSPPEIVNDLGWARVSSIVAIEEGADIGSWRNSIDPTSYDSSELLCRLLNGRRTGWFSLRFYDRQSDLIESFDFRYAGDINGPPQPIRTDDQANNRRYEVVAIDHKPTAHIAAQNTNEALPNASPSRDGETHLCIPYTKQYDRTEWDIVASDAQVRLYIELPRLWWRLRIDGEATGSRWSSSAIDLQMRDFDPTAARVLDVSVSPGDVRTVLIDFHLPSKRKYRTSPGGDLQIQLWDFFDSRTLRSPGRHELTLWLSDQPHSHIVELGTLDIQDKCIYCEQKRSCESSVFVNHIIDSHLLDVYTDISVYASRITRFYHCNYCPAVYDENWTIGQTEGIEKHVENIHGIGSPQENIHYVVSDRRKDGVRQIQEHLHSYRCRFDGCGEVVEGMTKDIKAKLSDHLTHCYLDVLSRLT